MQRSRKERSPNNIQEVCGVEVSQFFVATKKLAMRHQYGRGISIEKVLLDGNDDA